MQFETLHTFDTEYSADSIEWCPNENYTEYFACGTYQLREAEEQQACKREGRIYLFQFQKATETLKEIQRLDTSAILDMKWLPLQTTEPKLAVATALGEICIFVLDAAQLKLKAQTTYKTETACLALSLDVQREGSACKILMSDSLGNIQLFHYENDAIRHEHTWSGHNFEAWICAFDNWQQERIYSGGDDCLLLGFDRRSKERILTNKSHTAGVTCLLSHKQNENQLLTGSYDNLVRTFDTRSMRSPLNELNLEGGIWRLKTHPIATDLLLVACMYNNFHVVKLAPTGELVHQAEFKEHDSIAYGADWSTDVQHEDNKYYMATCSFYDHKMCLSSVNLK